MSPSAPNEAVSAGGPVFEAGAVATDVEQKPASENAPREKQAPSGQQSPSGQRRRKRESSKDRPMFVAPPERKVTPPSVRAELPAELEVELAAALGGMSVEEIMAGEAQGAPQIELEPETRLQGRVLAVHRDSVFVDLGGRKQGVLSLRALESPPEVGAMLDVTVSRLNPAEGLYELTLPGGAVDVGDWSEVAEGMTVEARVTGHNKGGLECEVNQLRGFIPASQISLYRVENLEQLVGEKMVCVVTEANSEKRNLVLSRRAVLEREKAAAKQDILAALEVGQTREGIVRSLQDFGAFVDLGGIDGLIHISQLSWERIGHPSEVLELGQKVKVKINRIDPATGKIGLGFRDLAENPWSKAAQKYPPRTRVRGTVTRTSEFGLFVKLEPGVEGLVHISELSHKRVWRASDVATPGQEVKVLVLSVDAEHQRMSLSLKALETRAAPAEKPAEEADEPATIPARAKSGAPLKGGVGQSSGGERFSLKW